MSYKYFLILFVGSIALVAVAYGLFRSSGFIGERPQHESPSTYFTEVKP